MTSNSWTEEDTLILNKRLSETPTFVEDAERDHPEMFERIYQDLENETFRPLLPEEGEKSRPRFAQLFADLLTKIKP